jgi:uncharacterized Fe-S center protein
MRYGNYMAAKVYFTDMRAGDKFGALYPDIDWRHQLAFAEEIGLGSREYKLVNCD